MRKSILVFAFICMLTLSPITVFAEEANANSSCVTLYEHINYKGASITFCSDDASLVNDGWNDVASSAKVSCGGNGAYVYEHINYKGKAWVLEPCTNYYDFTQASGLNDTISSINIR